jgi:putative ABC transport system ATP-binding protein
MKIIRAQNLVKQYGNGEAAVLALRGMDFDIPAGEFLAIMGESGSGKSTLLSILGGLNTPTTGKLLVDETDVYSLNQDQRADFRRQFVGFVFQNFHLIPYLTLAENVMLPLATAPISKKKKRMLAEEALGHVGLSAKVHRLPNQISGGEQERVAIARAIVNKPPLLLADEPTGNLDSKTGQEIMKLLAGLNAGGMTMIMVTHNSEYARSARRTLRVADGRLVNEPEISLLPPAYDSFAGLEKTFS